MTPSDLRGRRLALGLTQAQLALLLDVHPNTVACWERGDKPIGNPTLIELALETLAAQRG